MVWDVLFSLLFLLLFWFLNTYTYIKKWYIFTAYKNIQLFSQTHQRSKNPALSSARYIQVHQETGTLNYRTNTGILDTATLKCLKVQFSPVFLSLDKRAHLKLSVKPQVEVHLTPSCALLFQPGYEHPIIAKCIGYFYHQETEQDLAQTSFQSISMNLYTYAA